MGDGEISPNQSVESNHSNQFQSRSEPTGVDGDTTTATVTSTTSSTQSRAPDGVTGSIGQHPAEKWRESNTTPPRVFAANIDKGYSAELASHFDSLSSSDLESEVETVQTMDAGFETRDSRFVGGVAASRSGVDFSASDMYDIDVDSTAVTQFDGVTEDQLTSELERRFDKTFEQLDEYVAGKVATNIETVRIDEKQLTEDGVPVEQVSDPDNVETYEPSAAYDSRSNEIFYSPAVVADPGATHEATDSIPHEIGHAIEKSFNADSVNTEVRDLGGAETPSERVAAFTGIDYEYVKRDELQGTDSEYTAPRAESFREGVESATRQLRETYVKGHQIAQRGGNPSEEIFDEIETPQVPVRTYQLYNSSEAFAVGFAAYSQNTVNVFDKQPAMAEQIDEFVTGHGWEETPITEVTTSGVGIDRPAKSPDNIPVDTDEDSVGEIVRVESTTGPGTVGYAVEASEDTLRIAAHGQCRTISVEDIDSVQQRRWND